MRTGRTSPVPPTPPTASVVWHLELPAMDRLGPPARLLRVPVASEQRLQARSGRCAAKGRYVNSYRSAACCMAATQLTRQMRTTLSAARFRTKRPIRLLDTCQAHASGTWTRWTRCPVDCVGLDAGVGRDRGNRTTCPTCLVPVDVSIGDLTLCGTRLTICAVGGCRSASHRVAVRYCKSMG